MCFSPKRRTIFRHQNFQKCPETVSFFNILTCECASRHSGVQFFDMHIASTISTQNCFLPTHGNRVDCALWLCGCVPRLSWRHQIRSGKCTQDPETVRFLTRCAYASNRNAKQNMSLEAGLHSPELSRCSAWAAVAAAVARGKTKSLP